ncbi:CreA family protein [Terrihabitans sp. B22-R8]|uniref:CreA family protein n=1 Tax=Terrihabitans sp. B22-R8 TaxID=3425128 RepID=UPI00403C17C6
MRFPLVIGLLAALCAPAFAADDPDLIFKKSTVWRFLSPDAKLAVYAIDDPLVENVSCHFTLPEIGGWKGWAGLAEEASDVSLTCQQVGPISIKGKFKQGEEAFRERRSLFFKKVQIVRGCDARRNVLVYLMYTDKMIEGSPKNATSAVPIMPWGTEVGPRCSDFLE